MAPKSIPIADQILEAMKSEPVAEAIANALAPLIALSVQEVIKSELGVSLKELVADTKAMKVSLLSLKSENEELKSQVKTLQDKFEVIDRDSRAKNLIIRGLPESSYSERASADGSDEDTTANLSVAGSVCNMLLKELDLQIDRSEIVSAFRMKKGLKDNFRPIMVKFSSLSSKEKVYKEKKNLRKNKSSIFISDHLTPAASERFAMARRFMREKKIHSTWTFNGHVYVRVTPDPLARPKIIKSIDDLPC